jgi:hypothetical protein
MLLNLSLLLVGGVYWYLTGHYIPAVIGLILIFSLYNDALYFASLVIAATAISSIIYFFWIDVYAYIGDEESLQYGIGIIYMLVLFLKAKSIFNAGRTIF